MLPSIDFETYSEAGYYFDNEAQRWRSVAGEQQGGLTAVGAPVYAEHPSTEILSLAYDLRDGRGPQLWVPGCPDPEPLFDHIARGGLLQAWNSGFEYYIWHYVAHGRMGWPYLALSQLRCAMARGKYYGLPGKLEKAGKVIAAGALKIEDGKRLIDKFSKPKNPIKAQPDRRRIRPEDDPADACNLYAYNIRDIEAEAAVAELTPELSQSELDLWLLDQEINTRGVQIDTEGLAACAEIIDQAQKRYTAELTAITDGAVKSVGELEKMRDFLASIGVHMANMQAETITDTLDGWHYDAPEARRVLEIRRALSSASVKKVAAIQRRMSSDGRMRDMFRYCGAERTSRFAGAGAQPQNLKSGGPPVKLCEHPSGCGRHYRANAEACPWCGTPEWAGKAVDWSVEAASDALEVIALRDLATVEHYFGNALETVGGCLRGLFVAASGHDLICSDYVSIEAVVVAVLAGEEWRIEAFRKQQPMYEMSASSITGIPLEEYLAYKAEHGRDHPHRKKIGKIAELASPYGGGVGAWKAFGAEDHFESDQAIKNAVDAWRAASPMIKKLWYGLEGAAKNAIRSPGYWFDYRFISYYSDGKILYCRLPSGRYLFYHNARLIPDTTPWGAPSETILYDGWNSDSTKGPVGWVTFDTWGGKLTENVTQAVARDILVHGLKNVSRAGYPVVLHVHDEAAAEIRHNFGSIEEFEALLNALPDWACDWPIRVAGGWRGYRYRKD